MVLRWPETWGGILIEAPLSGNGAAPAVAGQYKGVFSHTGPGMMRGLAWADGVMAVPPAGVQSGEPVSVLRFQLDGSGAEYPVRFKEDILAAEEPLEITIGGRSFAVTTRTPGDDFDLFCLAAPDAD